MCRSTLCRCSRPRAWWKAWRRSRKPHVRLGCSLSIPGDLPMTKGSRLSDPWANPHEHSVKRFGFRFGAMPEGIQGWETTPRLAPRAGEIVMPAYHSGPFVGTWLDAALRSRDIRTLVCMGLTANGAAGKNIVTDATNRGYGGGGTQGLFAGFQRRSAVGRPGPDGEGPSPAL